MQPLEDAALGLGLDDLEAFSMTAMDSCSNAPRRVIDSIDCMSSAVISTGQLFSTTEQDMLSSVEGTGCENSSSGSSSSEKSDVGVATLYDRLSPRQTEDSEDNEEDVLVAQPLSRKAKGSEGGEQGPHESYSTARTKGIARKVDEAEQRGRDYIRMPISGSMRVVIEFLEGNGLAQYREMFVVNQIDQDELVKLTDVDLQEIGVAQSVAPFVGDELQVCHESHQV